MTGKTTPSNTSSLLTDFWHHVKHELKLLFSIIFITCLTAAINIYTPIQIGHLITLVQSMLQSPLEPRIFNAAALKLLGLFLSQGILTAMDIALVSELGERIATSLRKELYAALLAQDMAFFDTHTQSDLLSRLNQDVADFKVPSN